MTIARGAVPILIVLLAGCWDGREQSWQGAGCLSAGDVEDHLIVCGFGDSEHINLDDFEQTEFTCSAEWKHLGVRSFYDATEDCGPYNDDFERVLPTLNGTLRWYLDDHVCSLRLDRPDGTFLHARGPCLTSSEEA